MPFDEVQPRAISATEVRCESDSMAESSARRSEGNAVAAERTQRDRGRCVPYKQGAVRGEERERAAVGGMSYGDRVGLGTILYEICAGNKHVYTLPSLSA